MPTHDFQQKKSGRLPASPSSAPSRATAPLHPVMQLQKQVGNQAVIQMMKQGVIQRNPKDQPAPGFSFSNFLPSFGSMSSFGRKLGSETMEQTKREMASAAFGPLSTQTYDLWKLRKDPKAIDQYMADQIHRMDGDYF